MTDREAKMREWLTDPDPVKRDHAARALARWAGAPPDPAESLARARDATATAKRMELHRRVRACPEIDVHCGCDLPTCRAGKGDYDDGVRTSVENCARCLGLA